MMPLSDVYNTVNLIDSEKSRDSGTSEASINNELYYDNTNTRLKSMDKL